MFAALLRGYIEGPTCTQTQLVPKRFDIFAVWEPSGLYWLGGQPRPGGTPIPYWTPEPIWRQDICSYTYEPPEARQLDPLHPDAIKPGIGPPDTWAGDIEGWVSWEVETRPDCEVWFRVELVFAVLQASDESDDPGPRIELVPNPGGPGSPGWHFAGEQADDPPPSPEPSESSRIVNVGGESDLGDLAETVIVVGHMRSLSPMPLEAGSPTTFLAA